MSISTYREIEAECDFCEQSGGGGQSVDVSALVTRLRTDGWLVLDKPLARGDETDKFLLCPECIARVRKATLPGVHDDDAPHSAMHTSRCDICDAEIEYSDNGRGAPIHCATHALEWEEILAQFRKNRQRAATLEKDLDQ